jgi:molybdenum cofactor cytidylyltransferase
VTRVVSVVLAAGRGVRLGGPKALLAWPVGKLELPLAIAHAEERLSCESERVLVVTRRAMMKPLLAHVRPGIDLVASEASDDLGPAGSIAMAALRLSPAECDLVLLTPVDTPPASGGTTRRLIAHLAANATLLAVHASYKGRGGHPVLMRLEGLDRYKAPNPPPLRDHLRELGGRSEALDVPEANVLIDLDRPADVMGVLRALPRFLS